MFLVWADLLRIILIFSLFFFFRYPDHVFFSHCSSIPGQGNCGPEVPAPQVLEWDGLQFEGETFIIPLISLHNHNLSGLNMVLLLKKYFFLSFHLNVADRLLKMIFFFLFFFFFFL